ncbi:MAG TPA: arsenite methyltransferase [Pirellulaceae bacterium]|nr:arsenite methyltransferase [Pirellulaceae bacterium]
MPESPSDAIREQYGAAAQRGLSSEQPAVAAVAAAFGYSADELQSIPAAANLGLSCGNPTVFAGLRLGEVVVDLGCGGGLDVFLAARKVGPQGRAIGIDMTDEMLALARRNAARGPDGQPYSNVEFHRATIDRLPLASGSVDCVISNCVINLAPDKAAVFREIARVLKAGGRLAVSDIALKRPLPAELAGDLAALVGCIAGALPIAEYQSGLAAAGFAQVEVVDTRADLNAYALIDDQAACCSPGQGCGPADAGLHARLADLLRRYDVNDYAASVRVYALKA